MKAWVIEGKGLIVYPGFIDSFTDVGIPSAPAPAAAGGEGSTHPSRLLHVARKIARERRHAKRGR